MEKKCETANDKRRGARASEPLASRRLLLKAGAAVAGAAAVAAGGLVAAPKAAAATSPGSAGSVADPRSSFTILSFCGGGMRGLASVTMLNKLYQRFPNIVSGANMLAGTSTGGGIIAALAVGQQTPADLMAFFLTEEALFFSQSRSDPFRPAYSVKEFSASVMMKYPTQKLSDINQKMLFTSFNVGDANTAWAPILYNNFPESTNADTLVAEAVVSTGAMPGMFGSYQGNVDGAFVNHDPTLAAIALAVNSGIRLADIVVICFGTGFMQNSLGGATAHWGAYQWQNGDPDHPYHVPPLLVNGTPSPILNISLSGTSTNLIPTLASLMLPGRYAYLNPILKKYIPENVSDAADLEYLIRASQRVDTRAAAELVRNYWSIA